MSSAASVAMRRSRWTHYTDIRDDVSGVSQTARPELQIGPVMVSRVVLRQGEGSSVAAKGLTEVDQHVMASRHSASTVKCAGVEVVRIRSEDLGRGRTRIGQACDWTVPLPDQVCDAERASSLC